MMAKRFITIFLTLALTLGICLQAQATVLTVSVGGGSSYDGDDRYIRSVSAHQGLVYLFYGDGELARMDPKTREKTTVTESLTMKKATLPQGGESVPEDTAQNLSSPDCIFSDGAMLYGLYIESGEWYALLDDTGAYAPVQMEIKLDTNGLMYKDDDGSAWATEPGSLFAQDGYLYYTVTMYYETMEYRAGSVNLQTGEGKLFQTQFLSDLSPWKDGMLLCRVYDEQNAYNMQTGEMASPEYGYFDPQADKFTSLGKLGEDNPWGGYSVRGVCGNPETETVYYFAGSRIAGIDLATGEERVSAYTGESVFGGSGSSDQRLYVDGYYIAKSYEGISVYALDTEAVQNGALRVYGDFGSDAHRSFTKNYPDIPVDLMYEYNSSLEYLTNAMVSESDAYDVLLLNMSYMPVLKLLEKGYCMDLSGLSDVVDIVNQMNPMFVDPLRVDGKLYGAPVEFSCISYAVNMELWEELGLTADDLPTTVDELFDFLANWEFDYADDFPDIRLMNYSPMKDILFSLLAENYISYTQSHGQPLLFDTEVFRRLLDAFERIDFTTLEGETDQDSYDYWSQPSLFSYDSSIGQFNQSRWMPQKTNPLPLSLAADEPSVLGANVSVLIINPKTKRADEAALYVANYLRNLDKASANITLFPDHNEPVESSSYEREKRDWDETIQRTKELLEAADESEKAGLAQDLQDYEGYLAEVEKYRYDASAEQIADYRSNIEPLLWVNQQSVLYSGGAAEFNKFFQQYLQGALPQDQFVKELDKRLRMMELENQ